MKEIKFSEPKQLVRDPDTDDVVEVPINGETYFAYRPTNNQIALVMAAADKNPSAALAGIERFLESCLEPEAWRLIRDAVRADILDYSALTELMRDIIKEFAENPTSSSADSSPSPVNGGRASTANSPRPASTRATSRSRASVG